MPSYPLAGLVLALLVSIPLAWKWQLGILRAALVTAGFALPGGLAVAGLRHVVPIDAWLSAGLVCALTIGAAFALLAYRFYRDPERTAPDRDHIVISPADGEVIYVKTSHAGVLPVSDRAWGPGAGPAVPSSPPGPSSATACWPPGRRCGWAPPSSRSH